MLTFTGLQKMRDHVDMSENLKKCEPPLRRAGFSNANTCTVRFSIKDLERDFARTEDDIKAVQSVGQIIGEVMKQLDDERCAYLMLEDFLHSITCNFQLL